MATYNYKNLLKSEVDVDGNAEFHFEIHVDGELFANNASIICPPADFAAKFEEKCRGIADAQTVIEDIPPEGDLSI